MSKSSVSVIKKEKKQRMFARIPISRQRLNIQVVADALNLSHNQVLTDFFFDITMFSVCIKPLGTIIF